MNNDPKTAAQHNAPQTGEAYSTVKSPTVELGYEELLAMANYARLPGVSMVYKNDVPRLLAEREALVKERDVLREQVTKLREALEYIGGKTNHGHSPHGRCIICATVDKALAETEAR